jgi:hypothetical protein
MDERSRRSRGSVDWHTAQVQPTIGTPADVPVLPKRQQRHFELLGLNQRAYVVTVRQQCDDACLLK